MIDGKRNNYVVAFFFPFLFVFGLLFVDEIIQRSSFLQFLANEIFFFFLAQSL